MPPRKRKKQPPHNGSLAKNALLFCVSLSILAGASLLFNNIIHWPDLPLKTAWGNLKTSSIIPAQGAQDNALSNTKSEEGKLFPLSSEKTGKASRSEKHPEKVSQQEYRYLFYDILTQQKQAGLAQDTPSCYAVQIGAFKNKKQAQELKTSLEKSKRLDCRIMKKRNMNIVIWGSFSTKNAAERYNRKLSSVLGRRCAVVEI